jgi:large subunit ribosomal protein L25
MSKKTSLKAALRDRTGSGRLNQMRREGWLPSVIYGHGEANKNLKVDAKTFNEVLAHSSSENIIVNLDIEGEGTHLAFLQAIQHDPMSGIPLHADFLAIDNPAHLSGEAIGVKTGGVIEQYLHSIEITCLPDDLPEIIEVDISGLAVGDSLHLGQIQYPKGVRHTQGAEVVVVHIGKSGAGASEEAATPA